MGTTMETMHDDMDEVVGQGFVFIEHIQDISVVETTMELSLGLGGGFTAEALHDGRIGGAAAEDQLHGRRPGE